MFKALFELCIMRTRLFDAAHLQLCLNLKSKYLKKISPNMQTDDYDDHLCCVINARNVVGRCDTAGSN